jgi:hypothetical protein
MNDVPGEHINTKWMWLFNQLCKKTRTPHSKQSRKLCRFCFTLKSLKWIRPGDEIWFDYEYVRDLIWTAWDDNKPEIENRIIPSRKCVPTGLWNTSGFRIMTMLHARASFNAPSFIDQNSIAFVDKFFALGGTTNKDNWYSMSTIRQCIIQRRPQVFSIIAR